MPCPPIKFKYQMRAVNVNGGLARNWQRCFTTDDIRVPEGWEHAIELNGRMVSFAFVVISNAKTVADGTYIAVTDKFSREQVLNDKTSINEKTYIVPPIHALRPQQDPGGQYTAQEYLDAASVLTFTKDQFETWVSRRVVQRG